jgi:hypothetical protein
VNCDTGANAGTAWVVIQFAAIEFHANAQLDAKLSCASNIANRSLRVQCNRPVEKKGASIARAKVTCDWRNLTVTSRDPNVKRRGVLVLGVTFAAC